MRVLVLATALLVTACTTVAHLKPGVSRGTMEAGFTKTTGGLQLEVRGKTYDHVWDAVERAVTWASKAPGGAFPPRGPLTVVDQAKERGIVRTEKNVGPFRATRAYVGIFVSPPRAGADVYTVQVSRILKARSEVIEGRNWEAHLLRATKANLRT